jgi:Zn-dependent protease with chaperone function
MTSPKLRVYVAFCLVASTLQARSPGDPLRPGRSSFSRQQEIDLGQEAAQKVRAEHPPIQNAVLQRYVQTVGARLADTTEARQSEFPFTFTVIADPSVNAFALPGGPMFIHSGLIQSVDNEAQLAGVMAHEMSHVILRHGTQQASKANMLSLPAALAGAILGGRNSMLGQLASMGVGFGANSILLKYSREAESEADALGTHLMAAAGWDPAELAKFFVKLESSGGSRGPQFLSDHPNPGNREAAIAAEAQTLPRRNYGFETGLFRQAESQLGSSTSSAVSQRPVNSYRGGMQAPEQDTTDRFLVFRGNAFQVEYPSTWRVFGNQDSTSVTIAPTSGIVRAPNGGSQIALGAIVNYFYPEGNKLNLPGDTRDLIHHLEQLNTNLRPVGSQRQIQVNGHQALVTMLQSDSPFGGVEQDGLLTVETSEGIFYMMLIAPQNQFKNSRQMFERMISSLQLN